MQPNNKRIAQNSLFLSFRMLLTMCIGLYTSMTRTCPLSCAAEERLMWNWMRRNMKLMTRGELPAGRIQKFSLLLELADKYRRVNQYV